MVKRKYEVRIENEPNGNYRRFVVIPNHYRRSWLVNLTLFLIVNASAFWIVSKYVLTTPTKRAMIQSAIVFASLFFLRNPTIESFYVFRSIGVQISSMSGCILLPLSLNYKLLEQNEFIPLDLIGDIIINEGFYKGFKVIFYIAVVRKEARSLQLIFKVRLT